MDPNFEKDHTNAAENLVIPESTRRPPTTSTRRRRSGQGLYDTFNYLIYYSTDYDKQGLAAYKSLFWEYVCLRFLYFVGGFFCLFRSPDSLLRTLEYLLSVS